MTDNQIKKIVIVGGGTAGWMFASALAKVLDPSYCKVQLIESSDIDTIGVGEATIPRIELFNDLLELEEDEFIRHTNGTFKLGIEFKGWAPNGGTYFHPFGKIGRNMDGIHFYQYWLKMNKLGLAEPIGHYTPCHVAAYAQRFEPPEGLENSPMNDLSYAYHFDAGLYVKLLKKLALNWGVEHTIATISGAKLDSGGSIESVHSDDGGGFEGDFFVDCSGFRGLLIEEALHTGYESWNHWLPTDSAVVCQTEPQGDPIPYTRSTATEAGWQWRIPLQNRTGNGHVYSSKFLTDEQALAIFESNLDASKINDPRVIRFNAGKRKKLWNKNCVCAGLAGGFVEPLESTSIDMIQTVIALFLRLFPSKAIDQGDVDLFNSLIDFEVSGIRDFIIMHYFINDKVGIPFWDYCRSMSIPESLAIRMSRYKANGRIHRDKDELFTELSWFSVMNGQGVVTDGYNPLVDQMDLDLLTKRFNNIGRMIKGAVDYMPSHSSYLKKVTN